MKWLIVIGILSMVLIAGCIQRTFSDRVISVVFASEYEVVEYSDYSSSGGDRILNASYIIRNNETVSFDGTYYNNTGNYSCDLQKFKDNSTQCAIYMTQKNIFDKVKGMQPIGSFEHEERTCYFDKKTFVCFNKNDEIVDYIEAEGPSYIQWSLVAYPFNFKRSTIIDSIRDLKGCNNDSDCGYTYSGVCDPKCQKITASCDSGCRTTINTKYEFVWDFVPFIQDQCITDKCADLDSEYFKNSCINRICELTIVKK
jgi:hypothetical protein